MQVTKRDGTLAPVDFNSIHARITDLCHLLEIDTGALTQRVIGQMVNKISTGEIDRLTAETAAFFAPHEPDYMTLAARILVSDHHKNTLGDFVSLTAHFDARHMLNEAYTKAVTQHADKIPQIIRYERDYEFDFVGFNTLLKSYLLKAEDGKQERPQDLFMRVAIAIHLTDWEAAVETYEALSKKWFTHATPTLFNAGLRNQQLSSCFLLPIQEDSIEGIFSTLKDCALISKQAGGIGLSVNSIRAKGTRIQGTGGQSNGLAPALGTFDKAAVYVDQGGGKRKGSWCAYLEPWHMDIRSVLELKRAGGDADLKAHNLFYALWIPDLFMRRVKNDESWSLFCPNATRRLEDCFGDEFEAEYQGYENDTSIPRVVISARDLWKQILVTQSETGNPFLLAKDACNRKSNHSQFGTIKSSNLCTEIVQFSSPDETATCNLASIALPTCVAKDGTFDFAHLERVAKMCVRNLDKIIDINDYPIATAKHSNLLHRPMGIGIQGLSDCLQKMGTPFDSEQGKALNAKMMQHIYLAALEESARLATEKGSFPSLRDYNGKKNIMFTMQHEFWDVQPLEELRERFFAVRKSIGTTGIRNSLLTALMPTTSTSAILGNSEGFDPLSGNVFVRQSLHGSFLQINPYLVSALKNEGMWGKKALEDIQQNGGSVQGLGFPKAIEEVFKTVWEVRPECLLEYAVGRAPWVDQSQSMSLYVGTPDTKTLTQLFFKGWEMGLKTLCYYVRSQPKTQAAKKRLKVTEETSTTATVGPVCRMEEGCLSCSS